MLRIAVATIALIAAFIGVMYIRFSSDSVATPKAHVVVATQYINDGTQVSPEMVKVVERPAHTLTLGAYYRDMIDVVGGRAMVDIASGEPITFLNFDKVESS